MNKPFYRRCKAYIHGEYIPALFHRWDKISEPKDVTNDDGKTLTLALPRIVGVVEDKDGWIHVVDAQCIRFTDGFSDRLLNKWQWGDDKDE